jgi:hypothetical protein
MSRLVPRLAGTAAAAAALSTVMACGIIGSSGDNKAACDAMKADIQQVTADGLKQTADTAALEQVYRKGADKVRADAKKGDGDVADAGKDVATQLDKLGDFVKNLSASNGGFPDTSGLTTAGAKLKKACD